MAKPISLPATVYLRAFPVLPAGEVYRALGITRGRAWQMRNRNGFPHCEGGKMRTAALADWLTTRNCRICWI